MFKKFKEKIFMKVNNVVDVASNIGTKLFNDKQGCITLGLIVMIIGGSIIIRGINIK